jgi:hypothetical protein
MISNTPFSTSLERLEDHLRLFGTFAYMITQVSQTFHRVITDRIVAKEGR